MIKDATKDAGWLSRWFRRKSASDSPYVQPNPGGLVSRASRQMRRKMFDALMQFYPPAPGMTVLDVGVTCDRREDCNFFEQWYPFPEQITAVGMEDASFLEQDYPGVKFVQADGLNLPFADQSFDLVVSFAVIEHVGDRSRQAAFIRELLRVGKVCCITTPNRWYPIEFHTILPLVHWLPPQQFRQILRGIGMNFWAKEENLNLLGRRDLLMLVPAGTHVQVKSFKLLGFVSNLLIYIEPENSQSIQPKPEIQD
jgi:SAM-dependent methyltransferase